MIPENPLNERLVIGKRPFLLKWLPEPPQAKLFLEPL
jgi:hypothetical protein